MIAKGRVEVTITHPDGRVEDGYHVETFAEGQDSEAMVKAYASEFALCTALLYMQPDTYTELSMDEIGMSQLLPGVH